MKKLKMVLLASMVFCFVASVVTVLAQRKPQRRPAAPSASPTRKSAGFTNSVGMEFVQVPAGTFSMGSDTSNCPRDDPFTGRNEYQDCVNRARDSEKPHHQVTISQAFWLGKYEVTQAEWYKVMGNNPSNFKSEKVGGDSRNHPVEEISWHDAQAFIRQLNQSENTSKYRLPSEAEWEYACRAGTTGDYAGDLDAMAWYDGNSGNKTHPVGQKQPNRFGLYDTHGNVWEWCEDVWHDSYNNAPNDGSSWLSGGDSSRRVLRGGSWFSYDSYARSANRFRFVPGDRYNHFGFRLVLSARTP